VTVSRPAASFESYQAKSYFRPLDGLRAVSVLLVVTFHVRNNRFLWLNGANGVRIFFVVSGYIITTLALREEVRQGFLSLRAFYIRRAARIFPLYYLVLGSYCVLVLVLHQDNRRALFISALPYYFLYLQEVPVFRNVNRPFAVTWSLGIEEKFYLLWPFLAFRLFRKFEWRLLMTAVLIAAALETPTLLHGLFYLRYYADILVGCATAFLLHERSWYRRLAVLGRPLWVNAAMVALLAQCLIGPARLARVALLFPINAAFAVMAMVTLPDDRRVWLGTRPMVWLGQVSYALYLTHQLGLKVADAIVPNRYGAAGDTLVMLIGLALAIVTAAFARRFVEKPMIRLGRKVGDRYRQPGVAGKPVVPEQPV
jgi:peptidoglycan/LPS O-acetylase OafA/YrhL